MFTDTHCHLDLSKFEPDRLEVLKRAQEAGVAQILIPGLNATSSRAAIKLAVSHPMLFAAVGVHPTEAQTWTGETRQALQTLASGTSAPSAPSVVIAIGEIGLDYYWNSAPHETQKAVLQEQLALAAELGLPVVLHMREANRGEDKACAADLLELLEKWVAGLSGGPLKDRPGVLHSFSGSLATAQAAIRLGFYIGVTGPVTFQNAPERQELVAALPLECLLIETDAPFLAPHPHRGRRNEPAYVRLIADKIALLHSCPAELVAAITTENAGKLFGWNKNQT